MKGHENMVPVCVGCVVCVCMRAGMFVQCAYLCLCMCMQGIEIEKEQKRVCLVHVCKVACARAYAQVLRVCPIRATLLIPST